MTWESATTHAPVPLVHEPDEPYGPRKDPHEPPELDLHPYTREDLSRLFRGGEREADEAEARLVEASRARGGLWLRIGQGLRALKKGRRLQTLAFRFPDYARVARQRLTSSQRVRERDGGFCTVPGCSAHADDAHLFRSQGGHPTALWNQTSGCKFRKFREFHHTCIHEAGLRLEGTAPGSGTDPPHAPFVASSPAA